MIHKRQLGKTDLNVSEIGLGCFQLGGNTTINEIPISFSNMSEKTAGQIINMSLELGINTFDTADWYSLGNSEIRLGNILKKHRENVIIFTKAGIVPSYTGETIDLSYNYLISALDRSLKRLQTNYVDLFQIHKPPQNKNEFDNIVNVFEKVKSTGKSRYCGISVGVRYERGIELIKSGIIDAIQIYFSLIDPEPLKELIPLAMKRNVGIIVAEPLAQGLLTSKYNTKHKFQKNDIRHYGYNSKLLQTKLKRSKQFDFLKRSTKNLNQISIGYVLSNNGISTCIPGSKSIKQLKSNVDAVNVKLNDDELSKIKKIQEKWLPTVVKNEQKHF
jgi:aryl-alcohol dehydrogenase-like predicted oxidoreductase